MNYKLIALDIDATLTNDQKIITPITKEALLKAQQQGVKVVIASGRMPFGIKPYAQELQLEKYGGCSIGFNGGLVMDSQDNIISCNYLDKKYLPLVYKELNNTNITTIVHHNNQLYGDKKLNKFTFVSAKISNAKMHRVDNLCEFVDFDIHKILLTGENQQLKTVEKILLQKYKNELEICFSAPWFLEIMPKGVNKGEALNVLCQKYNISPQEVIACGDNFNDYTMIKFAGLGVAMKNATEDLKKQADYVTENDCNNDGIAEVIKKYIFF